MACKITIKEGINKKIDAEVAPGAVYSESAVRNSADKLNNLWGEELKIVSPHVYNNGAATLIKNEVNINRAVELEYNKQISSEKGLTNTYDLERIKNSSRAEDIKTIFDTNPIIEKVGSFQDYLNFIEQEFPEKSISDIATYKYLSAFELYMKGGYEQFNPLNSDFFNILEKYNADSMGVIHPEDRKEFTYSKLQEDLNKEFGDIFVVKVKEDNSYYVSRINSDENVVEEEGNKVISKAFSTSISDESGVPSQVVNLANKLANRFDVRVKIISEKQAREIRPNYRSGSQGFYDPETNSAYIIYERMSNTTVLHEAFSHPFLIYIKQNYSGLYKTLLAKAKANSKVVSEVNAYYSKYPSDAKDMEYITHAIDLEYNNQLEDQSLVKSIQRFWERILAYIKDVLGIKQDINKLTTFKDLVKFALNSKEKIDLSNVELMGLPIMDSYVNMNQDVDMDNINEPNLESRSVIDTIREDVSDTITKMHDSVQKMKEAINNGEVEITPGQKEQLDTITARVNTLSKDLWNYSITEKVLKTDKNLSTAIQYFSGIVKNTINSDTGLTQIQEMLKSVSHISQIMEEALVLTRYIKDQINVLQESDLKLEEKQRGIHQYYQIMQAMESSLKELYDFYVKGENKDQKGLNPVVDVINAIFSDIRNVKDIHSKYVLDYWAERITTAIGSDVNEVIQEEINYLKEKIKDIAVRMERSNDPKRKEYLNKEITEVNLEIERNEKAKVTKENVKAIINGDYGDSSYLYYKFMAAFNSPDLVVAGVDMVIEKYFMTASDDTLIASTKMNMLLRDFMAATGQTEADKFNVEKFSKPLIRKAILNVVNYNTKYLNKVDPETGEVTQETVYEENLEEVQEDVLLSKFMVQELNAKLKEYQFYVDQARKKGNSAELQKALKDQHDFRKKYFITPVTEEFDKRTINSNLITEEDIKELYDESGNPLSLKTDPDLVYAARTVLAPLYEQQDAFFTIAIARVPTELEIEEYEENERKIKAAASFEILGTTIKKTGKELAIARAINRSRELKRGVFKYTLHESANSKYKDRYVRQKTFIQEEINAGRVTVEEGKRMMDNWHKLHSQLTISQEYFNLRNEKRKLIDEAFNKLLENKEVYKLIEAFGFEDKSKTKKQTLTVLWNELYDYIKPLRDVENSVNGTIADKDLQVKIKELIQRINDYQSSKEYLVKLTDNKERENYLSIVKGVRALSSKNNRLLIENFGNKKETTFRTQSLTAKYNKNGFSTLKDVLNSVKSAFKEVIERGEEVDKELTPEETKVLQTYLFRSSPYAENFAFLKKMELAEDSSLSPSERKKKLYEALDEEMAYVMQDQTTFSNAESVDSETRLNNEYAFKALQTYNEEVNDLFSELAKLSERIPTSYYDMTVESMKQKIYNENYDEIVKMLKDFVGYSSMEEDEKLKMDDTFEDLKMTSLKSLKDKYPDVIKFVDEKFKQTDWYKNNHYKKTISGKGSATEDVPTPLWTESRPVDEKYMSIEPNNSYKTRSINEFLLDENGNPTDIRLKRGDTKIKVKAGDTLETLAQYYNLSVSEIKKMNPALVGDLDEGEEVIIKKFGDRAFGNKEPREYLEDGTLSDYIDPEYRRLESQNPALIKVIDGLNDIYYEYQLKSGMRGLQGLLQSMPRIETVGWETYLDETGPTPKKSWRKVKNLVAVTPQDRDSGYTVADFADKKMENIPLKFLSDVPYEIRSRDVFGVLMKFIAHANEISELNKIFPSTKELHRILDENSPAVKEEQRIKMRKLIGFEKGIPIRQRSGNTRAEHILHLINSKLLYQKRKGLYIGNWNVTKTLDSVSAATSFGALAGMITPNIVMNYIVGKVQIWIEVWSGGVINREDYNNGLKRLYKYFFSEFNSDFYKLGEKSLQGQLLLRYNSSAKDVMELYGNELKKTPIKDYLSFDVFFKTRRLAEFELAAGTTFAYLDRYKVLDGDNEVALIDAYELDKDGNLKLKDGLKKLNGEDFTKDDEDRIRIKTAQMNMILQGNYSSHHKTQFDTTVFGPLVMFFRKHLPSYAEKAFSARHFNYAMGTYVEGYQRKLWLTAIQLGKAIRRNSREDWESAMKEARKNFKGDPTFKKGIVHNSILSMIYVLLMIIDSEDDDDKAKTHSYDSLIAKAMIYQLMRLKSDLELISAIPFVAGLNESLNIIKSPSIVVDKTIVSLVKLTSHIIDYGEYKLGMIPEKDVVLQRDYYSFNKGDLKILKDLGGLIGVTGATFNPDQMVDKLKNINSALFR
jgi:hypothetical protein